jgi:membrane protease YdiL (CAAX protease family)
MEQVSGRRLGVVILAWAAASAAVYGLIVLFARVVARQFVRQHEGDFSAGFVFALYVLLFAALWIGFGGPRGLVRTLGFRFTSIGHLLLAPVLWLATVLAGTLLAVPFQRWLGAPKSNAVPLVKSATDPYATAMLVFTVVLLAPLCEELVFRGGVFGWLRRYLPVGVAAALSAAAFSGVHRFLPALIVLFVFGFSAALVYQRTGSTLNTFVMHACQNSLAIAAVYAGFARG